jgi:hypothetical protein
MNRDPIKEIGVTRNIIAVFPRRGVSRFEIAIIFFD